MKLHFRKIFLYSLLVIFVTLGIIYFILGCPEGESLRYQRFCRMQLLLIQRVMEEYRDETGEYPDSLNNIANRVSVKCPYSKEEYLFEKPQKGVSHPILWDNKTTQRHKRNILFSDGKLYTEMDI